ncbi:MAG: hypothetical protein AB9856_21545 [Cellulosilyticaceae bacterium]
MDQNWNEENQQEVEGNIRKLEELIAQLELWSDMNIVNHKKEQVKLEEYVQLSKNLYDLKAELDAIMQDAYVINHEASLIAIYEDILERKFSVFKETEHNIHKWIKEIKDMNIIIMKSQTLVDYKAYMETLLKDTL